MISCQEKAHRKKNSLTTFECMPRALSPLTLLRGAEPIVRFANGLALFCSNGSDVAARDIPRLERRGKMEARRKAEENSVKVVIGVEV